MGTVLIYVREALITYSGLFKKKKKTGSWEGNIDPREVRNREGDWK